MKKQLLLSAVLALSISSVDAKISYDEIGYMSFKYGLTSITDELSLDQHSFSFDFIGEVGHDIKPKLDFTYINIDNKWDVDSLFQTTFSAFIKPGYGYSNIFPYFYGGLGYEFVSGGRNDFDNSFYLQGGVGLEIPISEATDNLHIITEARFTQLIGSKDGQDNEIALFLGLRVPIGDTFSYYGGTTTNSGASFSQDYVEFEDDLLFETSKTDEIIPSGANKSNLFSDADGDGVKDGVDICPDTPFNIAVNKVGCPIRDDVLRMTPVKNTAQKIANNFKSLPLTRKILNVHFKLNSDVIAEDSRIIVRNFVEATKNLKYTKITVEGYTDSTGTYEENLKLSKRRAEAVKVLMIQYGVDSDEISAIGKGSVNPLANNDTEIGRAKNRRIEIVIK